MSLVEQFVGGDEEVRICRYLLRFAPDDSILAATSSLVKEPKVSTGA